MKSIFILTTLLLAPLAFAADAVPRADRIYNPRSGAEVGKGRLPDKALVQFNSGSTAEPSVVVFVGEGGGAN